MINLNDVLTCRRVMEYQGVGIEYTTGLNDVFVNSNDIFVLSQSFNNFGYLQSLEDFVYLLEKHNCLSKSMMIYDNETLADYLYYNHINIDHIIKLCEKVKCDKLKSFLTNAKSTILKYGIYVPNPKMKHYNKRSNNEKNLAETLDMGALEDGAYRMNQYTDNVYVDLANAVSMVVFNRNIDSVRTYYNLTYDDYLSDFITEYDYDMVAYCCMVASYLLKYSDIGIYGIEVFMRNALNVALEDFSKGSRNKRTDFDDKSAIGNIFDKAMNNVEYDYEEPQRKLGKKKHLSDEEIEEFKRYL